MKTRTFILFLLLAGFLVLPTNTQAASESDFRPLSTGGFGDSANSYSWGLAEFNGDVYVSTGRHHLWSMMEAIGGLTGMSVDPGDFIKGPPGEWADPANGADAMWADAHRAQIWRLRNGDWDMVHQSDTYCIPQDQAITNPLLPIPLWGHYPDAYAYRTLGTFENQIYVLGVGTWMPPIANTTILCSTSGDSGTWMDVTGNLADTTNIRGFVTWRDHVYVAVAVRGDGVSTASGCVVFRNNDQYPASGERWEQVSPVGFGDVLNEEIYYLQVFNDCLYASTVNYVNGFEVWKTDGTTDGNGMLLWQQVIKDGFGDTWCQYGMHMEAFGDYLYVGTASGAGMVLKDQQPVGSRPIDIIRIDKGDNAELVVGAYAPSDPVPGYPTQRVPLSMLPAGFGNPMNVYSWHMGVYKGHLYVGTFDMTGIMLFTIKEYLYSHPSAATDLIMDLQASSHSIPPEQLQELQSLDLMVIDEAEIAGQILDYLIDNFGGGDLWKTQNGVEWKPVTLSGFGNWHNYGFRRVVPVNYNGDEVLFIGTSNPFHGVEGGGCEVWANIPVQLPDGDINDDGIVDRYDARIIGSYRNQPASVCPECDMDGDGTITVLDARKLTTMCTYPNCASIE